VNSKNVHYAKEELDLYYL